MTKIEQQVMASVAVIYATRMLVSATALKLYALAVSAAGIAAFASIPNVLHNLELVASSGPANVVFFILYAVLGTTIVVQFALAVGAAAAVSLLVSAVRGVLPGRAFAAWR